MKFAFRKKNTQIQNLLFQQSIETLPLWLLATVTKYLLESFV